MKEMVKYLYVMGLVVLMAIGQACGKQGQEQANAKAEEQPAKQGEDETFRWLNGAQIELALKEAKSENKQILLDFTGSDWCPPCIKMKKDVLTKEAFKTYAQKNLVLVKVDFPRGKKLPKEVQAANNELDQQFGPEGIPTYVLLTSDGKELGRMSGYQPGGPEAFVKQLKELAVKEPAEGATQVSL